MQLFESVVMNRLVLPVFLLVMLMATSCSMGSKTQSAMVTGGEEFAVAASPGLQQPEPLGSLESKPVRSVAAQKNDLAPAEVVLRDEAQKSSEKKVYKSKVRDERKEEVKQHEVALADRLPISRKIQKHKVSSVSMSTSDDSYLYIAIVLILVGLIVLLVFSYINLGIVGAIIMLVGLVFLLLWLVEFVDENS